MINVQDILFDVEQLSAYKALEENVTGDTIDINKNSLHLVISKFSPEDWDHLTHATPKDLKNFITSLFQIASLQGVNTNADIIHPLAVSIYNRIPQYDQNILATSFSKICWGFLAMAVAEYVAESKNTLEIAQRAEDLKVAISATKKAKYVEQTTLQSDKSKSSLRHKVFSAFKR